MFVIVYYDYYRKSTNEWVKDNEVIFYDLDKAIRFCWSLKHKRAILRGYRCFDDSWNYEMNRRVNMDKINGWE